LVDDDEEDGVVVAGYAVFGAAQQGRPLPPSFLQETPEKVRVEK